MPRFVRAVFRQRARQSGLLILKVVLELFAIQLDQRLSGLHVIAKVHQHAADGSLGLGGNGDLVFGGERADDVDRTSYVFLANVVRGHCFGWRLAPLCLGRLGLAASGRPHTKGDDSAERKINNFHRYMNGSTFMKMDPCRGPGQTHKSNSA